MFQREIKFIYDFTVNKIKRIGAYVTYDELVSADIHPAILQYIAGEISYMIFEDRQKLLKESVFDYSGKNVMNLFRLIEDELKKTKRFDAEHIARIVMYAVSFNINHLVKPQWTLTRFIFEKEESKTIAEIKQLLNYVYYYDYINSILTSYFNKKKLISISKTDFEELLVKVDNIGMDNYLPAIIENNLDGVADFFNIGGINKTKIHLTAFELFLGEKNLLEYILLLKEHYGDDLKVKVELRDLQLLIKNNPIQMLVEKQKQMEQRVVQKTIIPENLLIKTEPKTEEQGKYFVNPNIVTDENKINKEIIIDNNIVTDEIKPEDNKVIKEEMNNIESSISNIEENLDNIDSSITNINEEVKLIDDLNFIDNKIVINNEEELNLDKFVPVVEEEKVIEDNIGYDQINVTEEEIFTQTNELNVNNSAELNNNYNNTINDNLEEIKEEIEIFEIPETKDDYDFEDVIEDEDVNEELENEDKLLSVDDIITDTMNDKISDVVITEDTKENLVVNQNTETNEDEFEEEIKLNFAEDLVSEIINEDYIINTGENPVIVSNNIIDELIDDKPNSFNIDINELIDKKEMKKIVEVIFNDDIEEFAETIEKMGNFSQKEEAIQFIETYCYNIGIDKNKKETQLFKNVITEYFSKR